MLPVPMNHLSTMEAISAGNLEKRLLINAGEWIKLQKYLKKSHKNLTLSEPVGVKMGYHIKGTFQTNENYEFEIKGDSTTIGLYSKANLPDIVTSISAYMNQISGRMKQLGIDYLPPEPEKYTDSNGNIVYLWKSPPLASF